MWIIPRILLKTPEFDPIEWYQKQLIQHAELNKGGKLILPPFEVGVHIMCSYLTHGEFVQLHDNDTVTLHPLPIGPAEQPPVTWIEYLSDLVYGETYKEDNVIQLNVACKMQIP